MAIAAPLEASLSVGYWGLVLAGEATIRSFIHHHDHHFWERRDTAAPTQSILLYYR